MEAPENLLKSALLRGELKSGVWLDFASPQIAELAGSCGFDWCLVDAEHGPNELGDVLAQLMALQAQPADAVVRVSAGEDWILKRVLDIGAQSIMVPMVENAEQASRIVRAVRYPPEGIRGTAPAIVRATSYSGGAHYVKTANAQICLMAQIESRAAVSAIPQIAAVEGVDVLFLGPADLSADMGFAGDGGAPEVVAVLEEAIEAVVASGKVAGIISTDLNQSKRYAELGARFIGVGADVHSLATSFRQLVTEARKVLG
jgi:4-hydroxy-2-oxoheptanedioate aldolase